MSATTLGEILRTTEACQKADCLRDLEQQANMRGPCAEHDLQIIKDFFDQAKTQFTANILARAEVKPLAIGHGKNPMVAAILQTFRWTPQYDVRRATHPYSPVWRPFNTWCEENELLPQLTLCHDDACKESWFELAVRASASVSDKQ